MASHSNSSSTTTTSSSATSTPQPHSQSPDQSHKQNPARPENSPALPTNPTPSLRAHFRESLARALFGGDELLRLRLKLAVADFMRVSGGWFLFLFPTFLFLFPMVLFLFRTPV